MPVLRRGSFKNYLKNESGNFGVWFAAASFPLLIATTTALDYRQAERQGNLIKSALDTAVLHAASDNSIEKSAKIAVAKQIFADHYSGNMELTLNVDVSDNDVSMTASGNVPSSIGAAVGMTGVDVVKNSAAKMSQETTVCVLALAPDGDKRVSFSDQVNFDSQTCAVHANSRDPLAIVSTSENEPKAKSFCSGGGASGRFHPTIRGECRALDDPYQAVAAPQPGQCVPDTVFRKSQVNGMLGISIAATMQPLVLNNLTELRLKNKFRPEITNFYQSTNFTGNNTVFTAGTYCGGITVNGRNVKFQPGVYIIKDGPLTFLNNSGAVAEGVTFVLHGDDALLSIEDGSDVFIKAPDKGTYAGLAIFQDATSVTTAPYNFPSGINVIASGGALNVIGTMYLPTQALDISGTSILGAEAPATSFIAYDVAFAGKTSASVKVDHVEAGLPPLLPTTDDGARLVK